MQRTSMRLAAAAVVLVALATACSGSDEASPTTGGATSSSATTTNPGTPTSGATTAVAGPPVYPLTGETATDPAVAARPALVVKIDNPPDARPQQGLNAADIVFEENVEQLTRFAAVFQSRGSDPVGPIRSGRTQDVLLLGSLDRPLFAWSGGNATVTDAIAGSDFVDLSAQKSAANKGGGYFRSSDRAAPHNLYAKTSGLFALAPAGATAPPRQFAYRAAGQGPAGTPSAGVEVAMDGVKVSWNWSAKDGRYLRSQGGKPHNDAALGQVNAANVVVMLVDYVPSPADAKSPEAQTIGTGDVWVCTGGSIVKGTWKRVDRLSPIELTDPSGAAIGLTPGRTWVELARLGSATEG